MAKNSVSDEFVEAFRAGIGGIRGTCQLCDRECFENDEGAGDWEVGELERLRERAKIDEKFVAMDNVSLGRIDGKEFVMGCPCLPANLGEYESFIWNHRKQIAEYIRSRVKLIVEAAAEDENSSDSLTDSLEQEERAKAKANCRYCNRVVPKIGFDEVEQRCRKCAEKLDALCDRASRENDRPKYEAVCEEIRKMGGESPSFSGYDDDNLPF